MAHEIGHNLGMSHDWAKKHGGKSNPCNKKGNLYLMGYANEKKNIWSTCSKKDFQAHYLKIQTSSEKSWCMEGKY